MNTIFGMLFLVAAVVVAFTTGNSYNGWWLLGIVFWGVGMLLIFRGMARRPPRGRGESTNHYTTIYDQEENR